MVQVVEQERVILVDQILVDQEIHLPLVLHKEIMVEVQEDLLYPNMVAEAAVAQEVMVHLLFLQIQEEMVEQEFQIILQEQPF